MATTPNFIRLESILVNAVAYLERSKDSSLVGRWLDPMREALAVFRESRQLTDKSYLAWRETFYEVIRVHKAVRLAYDAVREECQEWGITEYPNFYVTYTDEERTQYSARAMDEFLAKLDLDEAWVGEARALLQKRLVEAKAALDVQAARLHDYRGTAAARKVGYETALEVAQAFFADVKGRLSYGSADYIALSTEAW
jgi:hypothetical protein